jgi:DnaJ-class molecular chaperone
LKDYYQILSLEKNATDAQIKRAYRRMAMQWHPDLNKEINAAQRFRDINEAYIVLGNNAKRRHYDIYGTASGRPINNKYQQGDGKKYGTAYKHYPSQQKSKNYQQRKKNVEPAGDFKVMENMMFYSLMLLGVIAILLACRDLYNNTVESIDGLSGIVFGFTFTGLLGYSWWRIYRKKDKN